MNPANKVFKPTAPLKGSFPLDHDGECKEFMSTYMACLKHNEYNNEKCKQQSKQYLNCRMNLGLMEKEDFKKLGFDEEEEEVEKCPDNT